MSDLALDREPSPSDGQLFETETSARVSLFPKAENMRAFHFSAQQLRILESVGLLAGLAEKAYALPLNFKTKRDLDDDLRKKFEDLWRSLMSRSILLGVKIAELKDQVETTLDNLDSLIDKMEEQNRKGKLDDKIDDLKDDRRELRNRLRELDDIDEDRMEATPETIGEVERRFDDHENSLLRYFARLRRRTRANEFTQEADGVDITSARTRRRQRDQDQDPDSDLDKDDGGEPEP